MKIPVEITLDESNDMLFCISYKGFEIEILPNDFTTYCISIKGSNSFYNLTDAIKHIDGIVT